MRKITLLAACLAIAAPVFGADKYMEELVKHWQVTKDFTLAVAEAMPAESYGFKPNDEEMSFGKVMAHIGMANQSNFELVSGVKAPAIPAKIATAYKDPMGTFDKAGTIQFLTDSFDYCLSALKQITPEKLDAMTGPQGRQLTGRERLWSYFTHTAHHRGQAEVYLRVKNIKPPLYKF